MRDAAARFVREGKSAVEFVEFMVRTYPKPEGTHLGLADIGLSDREARSFSITRGLCAMVTGDWRHAEFERECSEAVSQSLRRKTQGLLVPREVLQLRAPLTTQDVTSGGALVGADGSSFVELLRNKARVIEAGATVLTGLTGDVEIPRQTGAANAFWVAEDEAVSESEPTFGQIKLQPKTVGALVQFTRRMLLQSSPQIEDLVRSDLSEVLGLAIDLAAIDGIGSDSQPQGILQTTGIGSVVAGDPDGATPTYADIVDLETDVAVANAADGSIAFITNAKVRGKLRTIEKSANTAEFVWEDRDAGKSQMIGHRAFVSNQVPSDLTKGSGTNLSAIIFGNWADLIIGEWSVLELVANPFDDVGFAKGNVFVRAMQDIDIAVRRPQSFSAMLDVVTT